MSMFPVHTPTPRLRGRAGDIASRRLLRRGRRKGRTAEEEHVLVPEMQQATVNEIDKGILKVGVMS